MPDNKDSKTDTTSSSLTDDFIEQKDNSYEEKDYLYEKPDYYK